MKKILSILFISFLTLLVSAQQGYRYTIVPGTNNKYAVPYKEIKPITYAATKALAPTQEETTYNFAQLTGAMTITVAVSPCYTGDKMTCIFVADATNRVVTFSTNFSSRGTLTVLASTSAVIQFVFNGTSWYETSRQSLAATATNMRTTTAYTSNSTVTPTELTGGVLSVTSGTLTLTMPTATDIGTVLGAAAGTTFEFFVQNSGSGGIVTVAVNTGITASGFPSSNTLTLSPSATVGIAGFRLTFISSTVATLTRIN